MINTLNFCICPTVQTFPSCQILPLLKKKKKGKKKATRSIVLQSSRLSLGKEVGTTCTLGDIMLFVPPLILLFEGKKLKPKNPFHIGAEVPMHRALPWGKILYAHL